MATMRAAGAGTAAPGAASYYEERKGKEYQLAGNLVPAAGMVTCCFYRGVAEDMDGLFY